MSTLANISFRAWGATLALAMEAVSAIVSLQIPPPTVLVVEDDAAVANLLRDVLVEEGYAVALALSGAEALAFDRLQDVHVVVFDYLMQHMDGREFYERLRALGIGAPAVMCSGWRDAPVIAKELGIPFVAKPFDIEEMLATLQMVGVLPTPRARLV
jgi:two-component system response regulator QseB